MSDNIYVRSKWTFDELNGESVEFKLPIQDGEVHGLGQFVATQNPDGRLSIDIRTILSGEKPTERGTFNFHLNQWAVDRIERHPTPSTAQFRCFG